MLSNPALDVEGLAAPAVWSPLRAAVPYSFQIRPALNTF
jgi:hypothetical protein